MNYLQVNISVDKLLSMRKIQVLSFCCEVVDVISQQCVVSLLVKMVSGLNDKASADVRISIREEGVTCYQTFMPLIPRVGGRFMSYD